MAQCPHLVLWQLAATDNLLQECVHVQNDVTTGFTGASLFHHRDLMVFPAPRTGEKACALYRPEVLE